MLTVKNHAEAAGELAIFKALYLENMPGLIRYACNYVDEHTAEDLVQDLFIKIWQKRDKVGHGEGIRSYLFRSVQHACLDYLKHQRIETGYVDEVIRKLNIEELHYHSRRDAFERETERLAHIHREIEKLPERCREIFTLAYLEEKKSTEIARQLQISRRTVEAQLYKALKILRDAMAVAVILLFFL